MYAAPLNKTWPDHPHNYDIKIIIKEKVTEIKQKPDGYRRVLILKFELFLPWLLISASFCKASLATITSSTLSVFSFSSRRCRYPL